MEYFYLLIILITDHNLTIYFYTSKLMSRTKNAFTVYILGGVQ
jgi:hypothetical protein